MAGIKKVIIPPYHLEYLKMAEDDHRRDRRSCIFFQSSDGKCKKRLLQCCGSSHCQFYRELRGVQARYNAQEHKPKQRQPTNSVHTEQNAEVIPSVIVKLKTNGTIEVRRPLSPTLFHTPQNINWIVCHNMRAAMSKCPVDSTLLTTKVFRADHLKGWGPLEFDASYCSQCHRIYTVAIDKVIDLSEYAIRLQALVRKPPKTSNPHQHTCSNQPFQFYRFQGRARCRFDGGRLKNINMDISLRMGGTKRICVYVCDCCGKKYVPETMKMEKYVSIELTK